MSMCVCVFLSNVLKRKEDYGKGIELYIYRGMNQFGKKLTEQDNKKFVFKSEKISK